MKKRLFYFAISCALIITALLLCVDRHPFSNWAKRVSSTDHWGLMPPVRGLSGSSMSPGCHYFWLSDHTVFHLRTDDPATVVVSAQGQVIVQSWKVSASAMSYDTRTHQDVGLYSFQNAVRPWQNYVTTIAVSPDGKWVYWLNPIKNKYETCGLDGREHRAFSTDGELYWLQDNHIVDSVSSDEPEQRARATVYDVQTPEDKIKTVLPGNICDADQIVQVNHDLIWVTGLGEQSTSFAVNRIQMIPPKPSPIVGTIHTPNHIPVIDAVVSPDGKQVVFLLSQHQKSLLAKVIPAFVTGRFQIPLLVESLWVCNIDGTRMREVGALPITRNQQAVFAPGYIRWLPSNKGVSFVYDHALYSASAE